MDLLSNFFNILGVVEKEEMVSKVPGDFVNLRNAVIKRQSDLLEKFVDFGYPEFINDFLIRFQPYINSITKVLCHDLRTRFIIEPIINKDL
jgi:hypothetical protein